MRRSLVFLCASLLAASGACSSEDDVPAASAGTGGSAGADAASDAGGSGGSAGAAGSGVDSGPSACALCGKGRSGACQMALDTCLADPDCKTIYDCVNMGRSCALDDKGAKCVQACLSDSCPSAESQQRFLDLDICSYCSSECRNSCDEYCATFEVEGGSRLCSDAGADAGDGEAGSDAGDDASDDAADAASLDASLDGGGADSAADDGEAAAADDGEAAADASSDSSSD